MSAQEERLRPHPSTRFAGTEHELDLNEALRALRSEGSAGGNGHRQIALLHHGPLRLILFAFEPGGHMPQHSAPGWVTIHVLRGTLAVTTPEEKYVLHGGQLLALAPNVEHDVDASVQADMLLGIYPEAPVGSAAPG